MKYLIPSFKNCGKYNKNAKYEIDCIDEKNFNKINFKGDVYFFEKLKNENNFSCYEFEFKGKHIFVSVSNTINISFQNDIKEKNLDCELKFDYTKTIGDYFIIFMKGKRNFVIIVKDGILFFDYYDEINFNDDLMLMKKCEDSLNHGVVVSINNSSFSTYLVYLDNNDMNLKDEFLVCVFLDCIIANNLSYIDNLISTELSTNKAQFVEFFENFDSFYPIDKNNVIILKKNTLIGVYNFEIVEHKIENIIRL